MASKTQFDLAVSVRPSRGGIVVTWEYSTDLFDQSTIARFAGHFETLLANAAARPETDVASLDVLTPSERHSLLVDWNETAFESAGLVHELFDLERDCAIDRATVQPTDGRRSSAEAAYILRIEEFNGRCL